MYAIRSYYEAAQRLEILVDEAPDCAEAWVWLGRLALTLPDIPGALDFFGQAHVITSYSIHYTKLYDPLSLSPPGAATPDDINKHLERKNSETPRRRNVS